MAAAPSAAMKDVTGWNCETTFVIPNASGQVGWRCQCGGEVWPNILDGRLRKSGRPGVGDSL